MPALDGVRAIAIAGVFLLHIAGAYFPGGAFGVDLFFALSAYLITGLLLGEVESTGRLRFGAFYWRRAFRLGPALLIWLVLASATAIAEGRSAKVPWSVTGSLFYFSDFLEAWTSRIAGAFDQAWSLAVEEQFYFVWPAVLVLVLLRWPPRLQRIFLTVSVIAAIALTVAHQNYFLPTGHLLPLTVGCWAAEQRARGGSPVTTWLVRVPGIAAGCCVVFALAAVGKLELPGTQILVGLAAGLLLLALAERSTSIEARVLGTRIPVWIGARSYGIYLYGLTLMQLIPAVTHLGLREAAPVDVIVTLVVVALSFRFVEAPVRVRGRRWLRDRQSAPPRRVARSPQALTEVPAEAT